MTEWRWPNEFDRTMTTKNLNNWTWPKLKLTNHLKPTNLNFTSGVLLISVPDVFFVEEQSNRASKAGQVSQPVLVLFPFLNFKCCKNATIAVIRFVAATRTFVFGFGEKVFGTSRAKSRCSRSLDECRIPQLLVRNLNLKQNTLIMFLINLAWGCNTKSKTYIWGL